jgi:hypothetical protein
MLAAAVGLLCLGAAGARAQVTARDSLVLRALSRFEEGDRIRVALLRSPFVGTYMGTRGDTVFFGTPGQPPMAFRFNAVDSLWRVGRGTRGGAWIGAVIGAVSGLAVYALAAEDEARTTGRGLAATAVGALGGAALGALVGKGFRNWRLIYGNPRPHGFDLSPSDPPPHRHRDPTG